MKGIILAGGSGTRLYPLTRVTSKQLLPVYDKPMIYYPLSTLMLAGIRDILIISTPEDTPRFERLLGDGSQFGIRLSYAVQPHPDGLAQAFLIGEDFIGDDTCAMILGDNIFYGNRFRSNLREAVKDAEAGCATIFGYHVKDPERFGVVEFDQNKRVLSVEEKPQNPRSPRFERLLGDGSQFGIRLSYAVQPHPDGLAQAFLIGEDFIGDDTCAMILGDNIFYGNRFRSNLREAVKDAEAGCATIFGYHVKDPERFGVVEFDQNKRVLSVEEKPQNPRSNYCVTGLYFYDNRVVEKARQVRPSARGELEITDLNRLYLEDDRLKVQLLGRGFAWLDTGTVESLMDAAVFVQTVQNRQDVIISAPEEVAYHMGWLTKAQLLAAAAQYQNAPYGAHLRAVAEDKLVFERELHD